MRGRNANPWYRVCCAGIFVLARCRHDGAGYAVAGNHAFVSGHAAAYGLVCPD